MYLCCLLPLRDIIYYSTVMVQYSLFVLKVQLNPKQTYKTNSLNSHAMDVSNNRLGLWKQFTPLERELNLQQNLRNISTGNLNTWLHYPVKHKNAKLGNTIIRAVTVLRFHYRFGFRFGFAQKTEVSVFPVSVFT